MSRYAARTDANHAEIRQALRKTGWTVEDTFRMGKGFPDLLCAKGGRTVLVEVKDGTKDPCERVLTPDEEKFHAKFLAAGAEVVVIESLEDLAQLNRPT